jgi:hypothetical protein
VASEAPQDVTKASDLEQLRIHKLESLTIAGIRRQAVLARLAADPGTAHAFITDDKA